MSNVDMGREYLSYSGRPQTALLHNSSICDSLQLLDIVIPRND